ncbi:hypothetical protein CHS0354_010846 [Potamilus streckersoni]|uniref:Uncharacterized protein n=1 Tax=Potamilus streckersoni TaxID=2493646 RepID=A0AAE0TA31_9BIVA|nr:hypothetical protein CHS0354_010846 [Potamilus streckersoni]
MISHVYINAGVGFNRDSDAYGPQRKNTKMIIVRQAPGFEKFYQVPTPIFQLNQGKNSNGEN